MTVRTLVPSAARESRQMAGLRAEVRAFLDEQIVAGAFVPHVDTWLTRWDLDFTRELARRGWLGMVIPREYGGQGRTHLERFVVTEELLVAGAPVGAHWVAERQIGPSLLRFGTEEQRREFLPRICAGEMVWAIGMSEPDSGSDLASVRTRARRVEGGWSLTGTKVWTSGAHESDAFIALARSEALDPARRHAGLSQFIVDLRGDGVAIKPILSMGGEHHFNEVHLNEAFVPDSHVLGVVGDGWTQVTSELGFERSGPERFLSTYRLLTAALDADMGQADPGLGRYVARIAALHQMSFAVSGALQLEDPGAELQASVVKLLGTTAEGDIAEHVDQLVGPSVDDPALETLLSSAVLQRPGFSLRGGTNEILRGVIARGLGMR